MKAAVTGGTGFLGQALIPLLVPQADAVRVLVRNREDDARIRSLGAEPVPGDLTAPGGCCRLVETGDVVFHAAARVDVTGKWKTFHRAIIEGTRRLLRQALPRAPTRFVHVSSAAIYAPGAEGDLLGAGRTAARPAAHHFYARAKLRAEKLVRAQCDNAGCPWTILRLGFLYGPGHRTLVRYFSHLARRNHLFVIGRGDNRIAALYVDDAARAVVLAGTHPQGANRIYDVAGDEPITQRTFLQASADALGLPRPTGHVPRSLAAAAACLAELTARLPGGQPLLSRALVTLMSADQLLDTSPIREELGWKPEVPLAEGMRRMRQWYFAPQNQGPATNTEKPRRVVTRRSA